MKNHFKSSALEWANQQSAIHEAMRSPVHEIMQQQSAIREAMKSNINMANVFNQLSTLDINEIIETIDEFSDKNKTQDSYNEIGFEITVPSSPVNQLTGEELTKMIDERINNADKNNRGFLKEILVGISVTVGSEAVLWAIKHILIPFVIYLYGFTLENHQIIIDNIQDYLNGGVYVVGYAYAKKFVKKEGLSKYDKINHIGVLRVDAKLRISNSKTSSSVYSRELKANSVVNIIEKKGNWLKVQTSKNGEYFDGWIEKSKVIKFKRKKI